MFELYLISPATAEALVPHFILASVLLQTQKYGHKTMCGSG